MPRRRWLGMGRVLLRTRRARRAGDPGAALQALARGQDRAVGLRLRGQHILILLDPELVGALLVTHAAATTKGPGVQRTRAFMGDGLLASEGETHRRARRLVAPAFSPSRLAGYVDTFAERAVRVVDAWPDGDTLDMGTEMASLTLDLVGRTLLGVDLTERASTIRASLNAALADFGSGVDMPSLGGRRWRPSTVPPVDHAAPIRTIIDELVASRSGAPSPASAGTPRDRGDVISALMDTGDGDALTPTEIHDNVITLLMAGHETTANALAWTVHLLGRHPLAQARLHAEVDALADATPTLATLPRLPYTRAVLSEAMRLYPPAWIIGRSTTAELDFDGWRLPVGSIVAASPLLLHHDSRWFADPEVFDPDRWLDDRRADLPRHAFLPFGTGPRACIGEQFAWAEASTVLAMIAARWELISPADHVVVAQYRVTLRPGNGVPVTVRRRTVTAAAQPD